MVDEKGNPVANARVILGHPCIPDAVSVTDKEGKFRIDDLVPGEEAVVSTNWNFQTVRVGANDLVLVAGEQERRGAKPASVTQEDGGAHGAAQESHSHGT